MPHFKKQCFVDIFIVEYSKCKTKHTEIFHIVETFTRASNGALGELKDLNQHIPKFGGLWFHPCNLSQCASSFSLEAALGPKISRLRSLHHRLL